MFALQGVSNCCESVVSSTRPQELSDLVWVGGLGPGISFWLQVLGLQGVIDSCDSVVCSEGLQELSDLV